MKCTRRSAEVYELRDNGEYAVFTVDQQPDRHHFGLAIQSSFGEYGYVWSHPGDSFYTFLRRVGLDYLLGKMVGSDQVFDGMATTHAIRTALIELRKEGGCTAEQARDEWPDRTFEHVTDFSRWMDDTQVFRDLAPWEFQRSCSGQRTREFTALHKQFWPAFLEALPAAPKLEVCG